MAARILPHDPARSAILYLVAVDFLSFLVGVPLLVLVRPWVVGLAVVLMGSLAGGALFLVKLVNVRCPDCHGSLRREAGSPSYVCAKCGTAWRTAQGSADHAD